MEMGNQKIVLQDLNLYYGDFHALKGINMEIPANKVTAFIGPSGCGKSTCLKTLNRMNDLVDNCKISGLVTLDGEDIYDPRTDVTLLRRRAGMVFQKPNPFPMSVYDNIAYGPRVHGIKNRQKLDEIVENSLKSAALWDEVKDRLKKSALGLSGGQQQRLCIARAGRFIHQNDIRLNRSPYCGSYGVLPLGRIGGVFRYALHVQQTAGRADRTLHHRPLRMTMYLPLEPDLMYNKK